MNKLKKAGVLGTGMMRVDAGHLGRKTGCGWFEYKNNICLIAIISSGVIRLSCNMFFWNIHMKSLVLVNMSLYYFSVSIYCQVFIVASHQRVV